MADKEFGETLGFEVGPCKHKGEFGKQPLTRKKRDGYCTDEDPHLPLCPIRYALFGLFASTGTWMEKNEANEACKLEDGCCPEYVEYAIPWKGKVEYLGNTDEGTGLLPGSQQGHEGSCHILSYKCTNPEILDILEDLYGLVKTDDPVGSIKKYLQENLGAPEDIMEKTAKLIHTKAFYEPRTKGAAAAE